MVLFLPKPQNWPLACFWAPFPNSQTSNCNIWDPFRPLPGLGPIWPILRLNSYLNHRSFIPWKVLTSTSKIYSMVYRIKIGPLPSFVPRGPFCDPILHFWTKDGKSNHGKCWHLPQENSSMVHHIKIGPYKWLVVAQFALFSTMKHNNDQWWNHGGCRKRFFLENVFASSFLSKWATWGHNGPKVGHFFKKEDCRKKIIFWTSHPRLFELWKWNVLRITIEI